MSLGVTANAFDFAYGVNQDVPPLIVSSGSPTGGTYAITLYYGRTTSANAQDFTPLVSGVLAPITVGTGLNAETVTPTAVSNPSPGVLNTCVVTAAFANPHGEGDRVSTGTWGITEAALYMLAKYGFGAVEAGPNLFSAAGIASLAAAVTLITGIKSVSPLVTLLNYIGITGAVSYTAAANAVYASTTRILY
jgi:hypothetical protein